MRWNAYRCNGAEQKQGFYGERQAKEATQRGLRLPKT